MRLFGLSRSHSRAANNFVSSEKYIICLEQYVSSITRITFIIKSKESKIERELFLNISFITLPSCSFH